MVSNTSPDTTYTWNSQLTKYAFNTVVTNSAGSHSHDVTGTSGNAGSHSHDVTGTSGSTGSGSSIDIRPKYYSLCWIMKT
jgi:hypothetical protein